MKVKTNLNLVGNRLRELPKDPEFQGGPVVWLIVDGAETPEHLTGRHDGVACIGNDVQISDGEIGFESGVLSGICHDQWLAVRHNVLTKGMAQWGLPPAIPGVGEALFAGKDLAVGLHQADQDHRCLQEVLGKQGDAIERVVDAFKEAAASEDFQSLLGLESARGAGATALCTGLGGLGRMSLHQFGTSRWGSLKRNRLPLGTFSSTQISPLRSVTTR